MNKSSELERKRKNIKHKTQDGTKDNKEKLEGNSSGLVIGVGREEDTWQYSLLAHIRR